MLVPKPSEFLLSKENAWEWKDSTRPPVVPSNFQASVCKGSWGCGTPGQGGGGGWRGESSEKKWAFE